MKKLSIVLPVYKVQGYLRQCLDSLLDQSYDDFEVIAVDDCSPDNSGAILAEYAARDPRVRVITALENLGLGRARNLGLEHAAGEYVWFLDSDDWLERGALAAVAARLRETEADVLIVGWDRVHWDGRVETGTGRVALSSAPDTFTVEDWPDSLEILHVAWNKVVRRDLLLRLGFAFEPGWYEDVSFTYPILVAAGRVSTLPRICVHYRQRRTGAITRTVGDRHFEVFDHWEHAMALAGVYASPTDRVRGLIFRRMIWHFLSVLRHETRVPYASRRRFFRRMTENYQLFLPPAGFPAPASRVDRLRYALVAHGSYPAFRALDLAVHAGRKIQRGLRELFTGGRKPLKRARQATYQVYYQVQLRMPVDDALALYAAYWYRGVTCNPAAIARAAERMVPRVRSVWVVGRGREKAVPPGTDFVVAGTPAYYKAVARAHYLINNVNWPNGVVKRPGTVHVMTHHGTPLKKMGLDQLDHPAGIRDANLAAQMRRADRWDFSVTANAHTTIAWERAYPCDYRTLEAGYPRNDRLALATEGEVAAVREGLGIGPGKRVILYAPTHREWLPRDRQVLDVERFAGSLGPDTVLLVRAHYFSVLPPAHGIVDVSGHPVIEDLYLASDVLLTDYSSAMFDYAVLDRPIVVFIPDWRVYQQLRGTYFDLTAEPPGPIATEAAELAEIFRTRAYEGAESAAARTAFRAKFCYLDDGHAAERVVRGVFTP